MTTIKQVDTEEEEHREDEKDKSHIGRERG